MTQNGSGSNVYFGIEELTIRQSSLQVDIRIQMHTSTLQTCHASSCALPVTSLLSRIPISHPFNTLFLETVTNQVTPTNNLANFENTVRLKSLYSGHPLVFQT